MLPIDLIKNIALLVALVAIYPISIIRLQGSLLVHRLLFGGLFGLVAVFGMMTPIYYGNGVIFDGRSVILAVAGLIGGPLVAFISAAISASYRLWLGGGGVLVGVAVIAASSSLGALFHVIRDRTGKSFGVSSLLGFGLLVHVVMLAIFQLLPDGAGAKVAQDLGLVMILVYPLATMLICLLFQDYEEMLSTQQKLKQLAYYDTLTGLPNRSLMAERLQQALQSRRNDLHVGGLMLINLDRFKTINDARGHAAGDTILRTIAERLAAIVGPGDFLARMSADEFAILVNPSSHSASMDALIRELAEKANISVKSPLHLGTDDISMSSSIGIAFFPHGAIDSAGDILRRADMALHRAKQNGRNQALVFDKSMSLLVEHKFQIERELKKAIEDGQLRLYLQSQVDPTGRIVGAEALVRWHHPERNIIPPAQFIPIAEESDLIVEVGEWVFGEACRILSMDRIASSSIRISVNVSPTQFLQNRFVSSIKDKLAMTGANPRKLTLEVTEGLLIHDLGEIIPKMIELEALGIHFALDDFGTGYSSLSYLKRLPIHEIKIDKSFVQDAPTDSDDAALVESILSVANHMELTVIAEGVETQEQADFLNQRGKVIHQGFLFHKPEPASDWVSHSA